MISHREKHVRGNFHKTLISQNQLFAVFLWTLQFQWTSPFIQRALEHPRSDSKIGHPPPHFFPCRIWQQGGVCILHYHLDQPGAVLGVFHFLVEVGSAGELRGFWWDVGGGLFHDVIVGWGAWEKEHDSLIMSHS